jgi:hypothetical protein
VKPIQQALLECLRFDGVEDALEGVVGGDSVGQFQEGLQPVVAILPEGFDALPVVGVGDNGADGDGDDIEQAVLATVDATGILKGAKVPLQTERAGGHDPSSVRDA